MGEVEGMAAPMAGKNTSFRPSRLPPELIIALGCLIGLMTFGPRSAVGVFQIPILQEYGWGSDIFSFAMAIQYLLWGMGQPFAGALADRYGSARVLGTGCLVYAIGLILMAYSTTPTTFTLTAGVLMGLGLSGCSFNMVIGALTKLVPARMRPMAFGAGTAAGSFGQFLFSPLAGGLVGGIGWHATTVIFGLMMLCVIPLALIVSSPPHAASEAGRREQSFKEALVEAFNHRSYVLLVLGFFTCGFQLGFVTVHFQKYVVESGIPAQVGYWAFALVGICNIFGSLFSGYLSGVMPKRWVLSAIYFSRAVVTLLFILLPPTPWSAYLFGALSGFLWLSTVPPTSSLIGVMFGTRFFSTLYGFAFFSHQLGGFSALMLSGWLRESTGSYAAMWWMSIGFGIFSALINLPIVEKPVKRDAALAPA
jgi:MFS family permease